MKDRELLELAAKAAGVKGVWQEWWDDLTESRSFGIAPNGACGRDWWNPLKDDGAALRLAVTLRLDIRFLDGFKEVSCHRKEHRSVHSLHGLVGYGGGTGREPTAENVRRAITLAAAQIGSVML